MGKSLYSLKHFFKKYQSPILSGIFIGTSYIPFPPWAALFAFAPLWFYVEKQTKLKDVFWGAWITQFVLTLIGFNWVAYTIHEFGHMPWVVSIFGMLIFCGFANLYIPLAAGIAFIIRKKISRRGSLMISPLIFFVLIGLCTALFENIVPTIFPWNFGYSWYWIHSPLAQLAELIGFQGLSRLVILSSIFWSYLLFQWKQKNGQDHGIQYFLFKTAPYLIIFICLNIWGYWLKQQLPEPNQKVRITLVQNNIPNQDWAYQKYGPRFKEEMIQHLISLSEQATTEKLIPKSPDAPQDIPSRESIPNYLFWPETAFPDYLNGPFLTSPLARPVFQFIQQHHLNLLTGAFSLDLRTQQTQNSIYLFETPQLDATPAENSPKVLSPPQIYHKSQLLAFGEKIPGSDTFPVLRKIFSMVGEFQAGHGPHLLRTPHFSFGPQICYEILFPELSRELAHQGADLIVNATNDSWYASYQEPYQHLYMTLSRSIEFRRPIVRATNTGFSAIALSNGELMVRSPLNQAWAQTFDIPYAKEQVHTFYETHFYFLNKLLWIIFFMLLSYIFIFVRRND